MFLRDETRRAPVWPYALLSLALIGAFAFGWLQMKQKNQLALQNENKYMQAFHKLKWTSENLEDLTTKLLASNSPHMQQALLADLRVLSAQAVEHMASLPLLTSNIERTQNYLNTLRNTAQTLHDKVSEGGRITPQEWTKLAELRKQSAYFEGQMGDMLGLVAGGNIRWADTVRITHPQSSGKGSTPITRSVELLERNWEVPPGEEGALDPRKSLLKPPPRDLGPRVDEARAVQAVKDFFPGELAEEPHVHGRQDPQDEMHKFSLYYVAAKKKNGTPLDVGVSIHGGHVVYVVDGRPVKEAKLQQADLIPKGQALFDRLKYPRMEYISALRNGNTMIVAYAPVDKHGVVLLTDLVRITFAQDNGEILGFDATPYWQFHRDRGTQKPVLSEAQARATASPRLHIERARLTVIANRRSEETLAWELEGRADDQRFTVYINAHTGKEENIRRLQGEPPG